MTYVQDLVVLYVHVFLVARSWNKPISRKINDGKYVAVLKKYM